jgi:hypothetical protein
MPSNHVGSPRKVLPLMILAIAALCGGAAHALPATPVSCPLAGFANASSFNGFYVTSYSGNNLSLITLAYAASFAEQYGITLTAHRGTYDGPIVGTAQTAVVNLPTTGETAVTFDFHGAPVTPGDRIAFTQDIAVLGSTGASVFYDGGSGACPGVVQTVSEFPPLGGATAGTAGVTITENVPPPGGPFPPICVPSDTTLCIDDSPGDRRFEVKASYSTSLAGGLSGNASAIPTAPLGVTRGGLFWFFSPDNPEVLVKVLNGCALNNHYWVYVTAGTNAGFTVTVKDITLGHVAKTYTNPDLTEALPVQDTSALASCNGCATDADCATGLLCCHLPAGGRMACLVPTGGFCPALP